MIHLLLLFFVAVPLLKLVLAIAWPGLLKRQEGKRAEQALIQQFGPGKPDPRLDAISERLLAGHSLKATFEVLPGPIRNAVALPNGRIYVWEGILEEAGEDEDMLAGVLAHELGHLYHEHFLIRIQWAAMARFVLGLLGGSWIRWRLQAAAASIVNQGFSRGHELQADDTAIALMQAAGFDPEGMVRLLDRLAMHHRPTGLLGTHPEPSTRAERIRAQLGLEQPPSLPESSGGTVIPFPRPR